MILQIDHKNGKEVNAAQSLSEIHKNNSTLARYPTLSTMDCVAISRHNHHGWQPLRRNMITVPI